jgi:hypothetical protein
VGRPGINLVRKYYYSVEQDVSFILERTANINVGHVVIFNGYDNPWMNRGVRRVNHLLDPALMGCDMAYIGVTDIAPLMTDVCTTHAIHLNSKGKRRLMHLIAESMGDVASTKLHSVIY